MRFGTRFIGAVDGIGDESIRTRFRMFIVPLWPIESHFVLEDSMDGFRSFPVPLNRRSVTLGYVRWWSFLGVVIGAILWWEQGAYLLVTSSTISWFASALIVGGCPADTRNKRLVLKHITGISAPPELQPASMRDEIYSTLIAKFETLQNRLQVSTWQELVEQPGGEKAAAVAYATARYANACHSDPHHLQEAEQAWGCISDNWNYWINQLYP